MNDPLLRLLERLPDAPLPDEARTERTRARCHAALDRQRVPGAARPSPAAARREASPAPGFVYLAQIAREVWRMSRLFRQPADIGRAANPAP